MRKSASNFNQNQAPRRRASSMAKINFEEFSSQSQQLTLLSEELTTLKSEKEAILEYNARLSKTITESQGDNRVIQTNHDKLHSETQSLQHSSKKLSQQLNQNKKSFHDYILSIQALDSDIEFLKQQKEEIEKIKRKEASNVNKLQEIVAKMRNELNSQEREREKYKSEVLCSQRQIDQLEAKVESLRKMNFNFTKRIKLSINN